METAIIQRNFAAGELSPKMRGRDELPIYQAGAEKVVNFISETPGCARFRSGFQFVFGTRRYQPAWLWPFTFNDQDAYEMEFTTGYIRFYKNGGIITLAAQSISGASQASPCVLTVTSHGLSTGQEVIVNGVDGMVQLNNRSFVITVLTSDTFSLQDNFGNNIDSTGFTAYTAGGTITPVYEIQAPYNIADVPALKIGQNADVLYIVHHNYEPMKLTRLADADWTISTFSRSGNSGTDPCGPQIAITGISNANPCVVTAPAHGYSTGQIVILNGIEGMTGLNNSQGNGFFTITVLSATTFSLNGIDSTLFGTFTNSGTNATESAATVQNVVGVGTIAWATPALTATGPSALTITNTSQQNPCQISVTAHGLSTGQKVTIKGVVGMTELNNLTFTITKIDANTFSLNGIDATGYTAYVSGGTATLVVVSEYLEASDFGFDIPATATILGVVVSITQKASVDSTPVGVTDNVVSLVVGGNIVGNNYAKSSSTFWPTTAAAASYGTSTTDLWGLSTLTPAVINATNFGVVISANLIGGAAAMVGTVSLFSIEVYYIQQAYSMDKQQLVGAVAFYQGRLLYGYSDDYPESIWGSQPLDDNGNPQYDYFNYGTGLPADAFKYTLSPISAKVDQIHSLVPSVNFLAICTLEGISSCNGGTAGTAISPETVDITPAVTFGCLQQITPLFLGISMLYVHRSGLTLYSFEYDIFYSAYNAMDKDLSCEQWSQSANGSGIIQMVFQISRPTAFWYARNDGVLIGRTYMVKENVNGIHRHIIGGLDPAVLSVGIMPRTNAYDQLWGVTQRTIGSNVVCFVEYMNDDVIFPEQDDFWTGNQAADLLTFQNAMWQAQKYCAHLDACLTYDGSSYGANANAELDLGGAYGIDSNTILLLTFQNNFDDSSQYNNVVTAQDGATISGSVYKYSVQPYSGEFQGSMGPWPHLSVPAATIFNFGSGNWTIDGWFYFTSVAGSQFFYAQSTDTNNYFRVYYNYNSGTPTFDITLVIAGSPVCNLVPSGSISISTDTWYHIAFVRNGEGILLFLNGTEISLTGTQIGTTAFPNFTQPVVIGANDQAPPTPSYLNGFVGYMNDFRVSNVARWTTNFVPPQAPYTPILPGQLLITATNPVFTSDMVGQQIWEQPINGVNQGQGEIVTFLSDTQVIVDVEVAFNDTGNVKLGWYITTDVVSGIWHLEGEEVSIVADGGPVASQTVVNGQVTIPFQASVIHVGLPYVGLLKTMNLVPQSQAGSTVGKKKTVNRLGVKFLNTLGASYGTNLYDMEQVPFGQPSDLMGRVSPAYSGMKVVPLEDSTSEDKHLYVQQTLPLPCIIEALVPFIDSDDE